MGILNWFFSQPPRERPIKSSKDATRKGTSNLAISQVVLPFYIYAAVAVMKKLVDPKGVPYVRPGGRPLVLTAPNLLGPGKQQMLVTCARAGLEHPVPMLLYPNDASLRQKMIDNPKSDPQTRIDWLAMGSLFADRGGKTESGVIWNIILVANLFNPSLPCVAELFGTSSLFGVYTPPISPSTQFLVEIAAYGHLALLLASADRNLARKIVAESIAPFPYYCYDEAEHRRFTASLLRDYQRKFNIRLTQPWPIHKSPNY